MCIRDRTVLLARDCEGDAVDRIAAGGGSVGGAIDVAHVDGLAGFGLPSELQSGVLEFVRRDEPVTTPERPPREDAGSLRCQAVPGAVAVTCLLYTSPSP